MSVEIKVPTLGESIVEATVGKWMKQEGDAVTEGEPLVELETDKVNMEVAAAGAGILQSIVKREGETVGIGEILALVGGGECHGIGCPCARRPCRRGGREWRWWSVHPAGTADRGGTRPRCRADRGDWSQWPCDAR